MCTVSKIRLFFLARFPNLSLEGQVSPDVYVVEVEKGPKPWDSSQPEVHVEHVLELNANRVVEGQEVVMEPGQDYSQVAGEDRRYSVPKYKYRQ